MIIDLQKPPIDTTRVLLDVDLAEFGILFAALGRTCSRELREDLSYALHRELSEITIARLDGTPDASFQLYEKMRLEVAEKV